MLIVKIDVLEVITFCVASDLFSNDHLLEIDNGVFGFHVLVSDYFFASTLSSMETPSHMWIFSNNLANCFLFSIVEISIVIFDVILNSWSLKWW